jgi:hypothetical protein
LSAVVDGVLKQVSASQINEHDLCPAKWYYNKVVGLPQEETEPLREGTRLHAQMEDFYNELKIPTHLSCIEAIKLPEVPAPDSEGHDRVIIEQPRNYDLGLELAGVKVRGRIDLLLPPEQNIFRVVDWKSTSSFSYLKDSDELARNPQGIVYLKYGFQQYQDAHYGTFRHVYIRTKGGFGATSRVTDPLDPDYVDDLYYGALEPLVERMKIDATTPSVEDVPRNKSACWKFGRRCPYYDTCHSTVSVPLSLAGAIDQTFPPPTTTQEVSVSISESLKARRQNTTTSTPPPVAAINPPDAAKPDEPKSDLTALAAREAQASVTSTTSPGKLVIYVDCMPTKDTSFLRLDDEIARRTPVVIEAARKADKSLVPDGAVDVRELKFGQGTALLVASFKKNPPVGVVVLSSNGLGGQVLEALSPIAAEVVRPIR